MLSLPCHLKLKGLRRRYLTSQKINFDLILTEVFELATTSSRFPFLNAR